MTDNCKELRAALDQIENSLQEAYGNAHLECCGHRHGIECCGNPDAKWDEADQYIMDVLGPIHSRLSAILPALLEERDRLREALGDLIRGYVNALESGRDRILFLGGQCDPVDVMESSDPYLKAARAALAQEQGGSDA